MLAFQENGRADGKNLARQRSRRAAVVGSAKAGRAGSGGGAPTTATAVAVVTAHEKGTGTATAMALVSGTQKPTVEAAASPAAGEGVYRPPDMGTVTIPIEGVQMVDGVPVSNIYIIRYNI